MLNALKTKVSKTFATCAMVVAVSIGGAFGMAHAELPTAAGTAITAVQTDGLALVDLAWPVLAAIVGAGIVMKLFKRFINKAT